MVLHIAPALYLLWQTTMLLHAIAVFLHTYWAGLLLTCTTSTSPVSCDGIQRIRIHYWQAGKVWLQHLRTVMFRWHYCNILPILTSPALLPSLHDDLYQQACCSRGAMEKGASLLPGDSVAPVLCSRYRAFLLAEDGRGCCVLPAFLQCPCLWYLILVSSFLEYNVLWQQTAFAC